jgi:hypothetical protein
MDFTVRPQPAVPDPRRRGDTVITRPPAPPLRPSLDAIGSKPARYATCPACRERLSELDAQLGLLVEGFRLDPSMDVFVLTRAEHEEFGRRLAERRRLRAAIAADRLRLSGELPPDPTTDRTGAAAQ